MTNTHQKTGWRERQRAELGNLIYKTALELFRTHGFNETTVQQITSTAGIAKGTFFNHFTSKDHVLQEWYRVITKSALDELSTRTFDCGQDAILALTSRLANDVAADPHLWDAKVGATSSSLLRQEEDDLDKEVLAFCKNAIKEDIRNQHFASATDANFLAELVLTVLTGTAHTWVVSGRRENLMKKVTAQVSYILDAAQTCEEITNDQ